MAFAAYAGRHAHLQPLSSSPSNYSYDPSSLHIDLTDSKSRWSESESGLEVDHRHHSPTQGRRKREIQLSFPRMNSSGLSKDINQFDRISDSKLNFFDKSRSSSPSKGDGVFDEGYLSFVKPLEIEGSTSLAVREVAAF